MPEPKKQKQISCQVVLEIASQAYENRPTTRMVLRVVNWIVDGKRYPQLEKRELYRDEAGEEKMGKAKGFTLKDLTIMSPRWNEILAALGSKLPEHTAPAKAQEPEPAAATKHEEDF